MSEDMNMNKTMRWTGALLLLALATTGARAASPARLNINVSITQNLSVSVNAADTSTNTVAWNTANPNERLVPVGLATSTVLNDSGAQTERWQLSTNLQTIPVSGSEFWTLSVDSSTVGTEQFALQAVFGSSNTAACPIAAAADWDQDTATEITTTPEFYTSTRFTDPALDGGINGGTPEPDVPASGRMHAGSFRALCWRVIAPASTAASATQNIQLIVTAFAP